MVVLEASSFALALNGDAGMRSCEDKSRLAAEPVGKDCNENEHRAMKGSARRPHDGKFIQVG